jgi:hypothetical protein
MSVPLCQVGEGYAASSIERAAERRADGTALAALKNDPHARAYVVAGELVILKKAIDFADPLFTLAETRALDGFGVFPWRQGPARRLRYFRLGIQGG